MILQILVRGKSQMSFSLSLNICKIICRIFINLGILQQHTAIFHIPSNNNLVFLCSKRSPILLLISQCQHSLGPASINMCLTTPLFPYIVLTVCWAGVLILIFEILCKPENHTITGPRPFCEADYLSRKSN